MRENEQVSPLVSARWEPAALTGIGRHDVYARFRATVEVAIVADVRT